MTSLELVKKAIHLEAVERVPWVPFTGVHAGKLIGLHATEYLKSADDIVRGVSKAVEMYRPDGIPVMFDLQVEAEVLGCDLQWSDDNPPAVVSHPLLNGQMLADLHLPDLSSGRIPVVMEATRRLREKFPDLALYGLVTGPFTLGLHLLGTDIFMKFFEDPDYVHDLMRFTSEVGIMMAGEYIDNGCDVIAMVDPMTSQIDPDSFTEFVSPYATRIFDYIRSRQSLSSFFVCGNATQNIEVMCFCRPDNVSIDENIPLDYVRDTALPLGVSFGGNMRLTVVLLLGTEEDCQREALACIDTGGLKGFLLAPGCDLPMDTPVENLKAVTSLVYDDVLQGTLRASEATLTEAETLDLTTHWHPEKVIIDVVTLDSGSCAPCQYMFDAALRAAEPFGDQVLCREYSIKEKDGVNMMAALGVQSIPTIVMDGKLEFISQIPPVNKISERIEEHLKAKQQ